MSNNKQSSSIDFFWNQLPEILPFTVDTETAVKLLEAFEQAKAMHKDEIVNAVTFGQNNHTVMISHDLIIATDYYNETFGGNNEQQ